MPSAPTTPGVYIDELPAGTRAIGPVPTSVTVFIGRAACGEVGRPIPVGSLADFTRRFGPPLPNDTLACAVRLFFANGGTQAVVLRLYRPDAAAPAACARLAIGRTPAATLHLQAADEGAWGSGLRARVAHVSHPAGDDTLFDLRVRHAATGQVELHRQLSVQPGHPRCVREVLEKESSLLRLDGELPATRPPQAGSRRLARGSDGLLPDAACYLGDADAGTGLQALARLHLFNLLCITAPDANNDVPPEVWSAAAGHCTRHRAVLLIDPPAAWQHAADAVAGAAALCPGEANAALYFPRLSATAVNGAAASAVAPCGAVAGVIARTDARRGVWKAPAGREAVLAGITGPALPLDDAANGELNRAGINALRHGPDGAAMVWGARTRQGSDAQASDWKYLPVRRLALHIEQSLSRGLAWAVFEPDDEPLWTQLRAQALGFLEGLFRQGAFQGDRASQAYFVRCDAETTSAFDAQRGIVNMMVGFAPLRPAEFVLLRLVLQAATG